MRAATRAILPVREPGGRRLQLLERRENHHVALETGGRGGRGLPERGHDERLRRGGDELRALSAPRTQAVSGKALDVHVLKAERLQARGGPLGGLRARSPSPPGADRSAW